MDSASVTEAFHNLISEVDCVLQKALRSAADALDERDYDRAREQQELAGRISRVRDSIENVRESWEKIFDSASPFPLPEPAKRTPPVQYRLPILRALVALGGMGSCRDVLERVYQEMRSRLTQFDLDHLPSNKSVPRWENAAHWERLRMVKEGLLQKDSPKGVWQITEKGRRFFERGEQ